MATLTTSKDTIVATPTDNTEVLRHILEVERGVPVSYEEAFKIGQSLIGLCQAFTDSGGEP